MRHLVLVLALVPSLAAADDKLAKLREELARYDSTLFKITDVVKPGDSVLTAYLIDEYAKFGDPASCKAAAKTASELDGSLKIKSFALHGDVAIADFDARICEALASTLPQWLADSRAALVKGNATARAKYSAAGIAGDKLDLIAKYDGVYWRLVGGDRTDDPKKLAKARVLFQWLEAEDKDDTRFVIHTIRRYQFKGNTLAGTTEKQYRRAKGARIGNVFK